jgi:Tol biopolymer transport system component
VTVIDPVDALDAQVLIDEARAHQRRRRRRVAVLVVLAAAAGVGGWLWSGTGGGGGGRVARPFHPVRPVPQPRVRPVVDAAAMRGHGTLVFVSHRALWSVSSGGGLQLLLPAADHPSHPTYSADGKWLEVSGTNAGHRVIWLARRDGQDLHAVAVRRTAVDRWSPRGHLLALHVSPSRAGRSALFVLDPSRGERTVAQTDGWFTGVVWSPDGRSLAAATSRSPDGQTTMTSYPLSGAPSTTWLSVNDRHGRLAGMTGLLLQPVGWWRGQGIAFWVYGNGMVDNLDQTPLLRLPSPGATSQRLGSTLSGTDKNAVTASNRGDLALVDQTGRQSFGRLIWQHKRVEVCAAGSATCAPVPAPARTVTIDPSWSPNGRTLLYDQAPRLATPGFPQGLVHRWYAENHLLTYRPATSARRVLPGTAGASAAQWSANGRTILFERDDGLWLLNRGSAGPMRVATPLFPRHAWPAYYGQIDWTGQFAWSDVEAR